MKDSNYIADDNWTLEFASNWLKRLVEKYPNKTKIELVDQFMDQECKQALMVKGLI